MPHARHPTWSRLFSEQGTVEQFATAGPHPSLHHGVHARNSYAGEHDLDSGVGEDRVEQRWVLAVVATRSRLQ
jgi:hypothetical protein